MDSRLYSIQIEQSVLSAIMSLDGGIDDIMQKLTVDSFHATRHQVIFKTIKSLFSEGKAYDVVAVHDEIKMNHDYNMIVTEEYLIELNSTIGLAHLLDKHADRLNEHSRRRSLFNASKEIERISIDTSSYTCDEAVAKAGLVLDGIDIDDEKDTNLKNAFDLSVNLYETILNRVKDRENGTEKIKGIRTGFRDLDKQIGNFANGDLIYIGARPSMGKTAFAQDIMIDTAFAQQHPILFHSIEMSADKITQRIVSSLAEINSNHIRDAEIPDEKWGDFNKASLMLQKSKFLIDDSSSVSLSDIRRNCRKLKSKYGYVGAIFIDYLTLMKAEEKSDRNDLMIGSISKGLKRIAKEFNCPVVCLAQLSRALEKRPDKRPMLSDLRESGSIEEDADVVLFIYRDEYYDKNSKEKGITEIIAAKVRDGVVGTVRLATELQYSRFRDLDMNYLNQMQGL